MHKRDVLNIKTIDQKLPLIGCCTNDSGVILSKKLYRVQGCFSKDLAEINELTSRKSEKTPVTSLLEVNKLTITNPKEISNGFNNHFSTIGLELACEIYSDG
ncbi:hypothetical protein pdam_00014854 [Pocillopora damicornis]|uniref:Uncharacterized protein n=1 Tax=Pocillopora damicornis TaxID=46731 RepID=A0A3M6UCV2_POCDA|nr:hypothetical protein pdam_00014854 [Pocillopora damicornis]